VCSIYEIFALPLLVPRTRAFCLI